MCVPTQVMILVAEHMGLCQSCLNALAAADTPAGIMALAVLTFLLPFGTT